nr:CotS family spore coat protein [Salsuginibacillus kocurii]
MKPWAQEIIENNLDPLYVPDYIKEMAKEVVKSYDFEVQQWTVMALKDEQGGAIWKIDTNKGPFSLKILHRRPMKSKFSLGAQNYLVKEKKARVPAIVQTKDGEDYVEMGGKLWFVAKWIEDLREVAEDLEGTKKLCYALGEFHKLSRGYKPPADAEIQTRLHRWPRTYERVELKMEWFRNVANAYDEYSGSQTILSVLDTFEKHVQEARARLNNSSYHEIAARGIEDAALVHQDYGWSNAQMGDEGMWIIDLDGVAFDIPIRDLRKLIEERIHALGEWDINWIREMITAYEQAHPITDETYEMLLIDLSMPNLFYKHVKDIIYDPPTFLTTEVDELPTVIELEEKKWPVLQELASDRKGGPTFK